jgi:hypothetical protein
MSFSEDVAWCFPSERSETCASFFRRLTFVSAADFVWTSVTGALSGDCFGGFTFKAKETEEEGT